VTSSEPATGRHSGVLFHFSPCVPEGPATFTNRPHHAGRVRLHYNPIEIFPGFVYIIGLFADTQIVFALTGQRSGIIQFKPRGRGFWVPLRGLMIPWWLRHIITYYP
ncbi:hypothetical protein, partial [Paracoccus yeei]